MNSDILLISDPEVLRVPIKENEEPIIDLLDYPEILVDSRKKSASFAKVRKGVFEKLSEAQSSLPRGIRFLFIEGFRPLSLQRKYFEEYSEELRNLHPSWDKNTVYHEASKYVAPPEIVPPHSTGGAIDLTLATKAGVELDMGTRVNADPGESQNACFTSIENISDKAKQNRQILIASLEGVGFVNYPTEWWHWSYGDRYWGYHNKRPAVYGSRE